MCVSLHTLALLGNVDEAASIVSKTGNIVLAPESGTAHPVARRTLIELWHILVESIFVIAFGYQSAKLCAHVLAVAELCGVLTI